MHDQHHYTIAVRKAMMTTTLDTATSVLVAMLGLETVVVGVVGVVGVVTSDVMDVDVVGVMVSAIVLVALL